MLCNQSSKTIDVELRIVEEEMARRLEKLEENENLSHEDTLPIENIELLKAEREATVQASLKKCRE